MLKIQKECAKLASDRGNGNFMSAGFMQELSDEDICKAALG